MEYQDLADHSRVWIYQANRMMNGNEVQEIEALGRRFIQSWAAHGAALQAAFHIFENRFLVLFADESQVKASGCSIDSSVHFFQQLDQHYQLDLFNRLNITYVEGEEIAMLPMAEFQTAIQEGSINAETTVFNNLVTNKGEFDAAWKGPLKESWHKQLLN